MWGVIFGHGDVGLSLNSSWGVHMVGGSWGGVGTIGGEVYCWLTNDSLPCSGAVRICFFWEGKSLVVATGMIGREDKHCL